MAPFVCLKNGLFGFFFQLEQCFSLTTIQPEQCFSASFRPANGTEVSSLSSRRASPATSPTHALPPLPLPMETGHRCRGASCRLRAKGHPRACPVLVVLARRRLPPWWPESIGPSLISFVANLCFSCFRGMLQVFNMNIAKVDWDVEYVAMVIHVGCKHVF